MVRGILRCVTLSAFLVMSGCAATRPQVTSDLESGLQAAASLETVYATLPSADPQVVAKLTLLLTVAQAALGTYAASASPADAAAAEAAIAAAMTYASMVNVKH